VALGGTALSFAGTLTPTQPHAATSASGLFGLPLLLFLYALVVERIQFVTCIHAFWPPLS
jgi:hypothetical protein